jgi:hypothetical protein
MLHSDMMLLVMIFGLLTHAGPRARGPQAQSEPWHHDDHHDASVPVFPTPAVSLRVAGPGSATDRPGPIRNVP